MSYSKSLSLVQAYKAALGTWGSIILLLMVQEVDRRFKRSRLGAILSIAEPFLLITAILIFRSVLLERLPRYGQSAAVWYSSGIFPFYLFVRLSAIGGSVPYGTARRFPRITSADQLFASIMTEASIFLTMMFIWFVGMWFWGLSEAMPASILECLVALSFCIALGVGFGLVSSAISRRLPIWRLIHGFVSRALMFASAVYWVTDLMPYRMRAYAIWNPLDHALTWFRVGLYGELYPHHTLDRDYLIEYAVIALLIGIVAYRSTLRTDRT